MARGLARERHREPLRQQARRRSRTTEGMRCRSWRLEKPALTIALRSEPGERWRAAADGGKRQRFLRIRNRLRHDTICAVGELIDAPQLFGTAAERDERDQFL